MGDAKYKSQKETSPTLLEMLLRLEGDIRRRLEPIRLTPLQAGVILFLRRNVDVCLTETATMLRVNLSTMGRVVKNLERKRWVTKRRSVNDDRIVCLSLTRWGEALARHIEKRLRVRQMNATRSERRTLGMITKGCGA